MTEPMGVLDIVDRLEQLQRRIEQRELPPAAIATALRTLAQDIDPRTEPLDGPDKYIRSKELERVENRMAQIAGTYSGLQSWAKEDAIEHKRLRLLRTELRKSLGLE